MQQPHLFQLISTLVQEGITKAQDLLNQGEKPTPEHGLPEVDVRDNGWVFFNQGKPGAWWDFGQISLYRQHPFHSESFQALRMLVDQDAKLSRFFESRIGSLNTAGKDSQVRDTLLPAAINGVLVAFMNRYMNTYPRENLDASTFEGMYQEWENAVYWDVLPVDIVVPLLNIDFNGLDDVAFPEGLSIEKMEHTLQVARARFMPFQGGYAVGADASSPAQHALVLRGFNINNEGLFRTSRGAYTLTQKPEVTQKIEHFLALLRAVTEAKTGHAQVMVVPRNWTMRVEHDVPDVMLVQARAYPIELESYDPKRRPTTIASSDLNRVLQLLNSFQHIKLHRLPLALRRLNEAHQRLKEEDSILDVTIALEALLTYDSKSEIQYRLNTRLAVLFSLAQNPPFLPEDIKNLCKKVYDFRSKVIHGEDALDKLRTFKHGSDDVLTLDVALRLLRFVVLFLIENPEYLDCLKVDALMWSRSRNPVSE